MSTGPSPSPHPFDRHVLTTPAPTAAPAPTPTPAPALSASASASDADTPPDTAAPAPDPDCPFCHIASTYAPFPPTHPPSCPPSPSSSLTPPSLSPALTSPSPPTFVILSTPALIAFLDIMPLSRGHLLLCPRAHAPKLTSVTPRDAADLGGWLRVLSAAVVRATQVRDWNVVQNNGAAAAQVVGHVHYHLIPRPELRALQQSSSSSSSPSQLSRSFTMFGRGVREELGDDEGAALAADLRRAIADVLAEEAQKGKL
ncbi:HIT-like domain-containing protein [Xylariaceae sp. FL0804]|nr:HIT-like domain-containing protein [Xylariaceae sp. FL0804]